MRLVNTGEYCQSLCAGITNGTGSKVAGSIDYGALDCTAATVFEEQKCQKIVFNGKEGKTVLIEAITSVPEAIRLADKGSRFEKVTEKMSKQRRKQTVTHETSSITQHPSGVFLLNTSKKPRDT